MVYYHVQNGLYTGSYNAPGYPATGAPGTPLVATPASALTPSSTPTLAGLAPSPVAGCTPMNTGPGLLAIPCSHPARAAFAGLGPPHSAAAAAAFLHKLVIPHLSPSQLNFLFKQRMDKKAFTKPVECEVCGIMLNSDQQAQQHYSGKAHLKALRRAGKPIPQEHINKIRAGKRRYTCTCKDHEHTYYEPDDVIENDSRDPPKEAGDTPTMTQTAPIGAESSGDQTTPTIDPATSVDSPISDPLSANSNALNSSTSTQNQSTSGECKKSKNTQSSYDPRNELPSSSPDNPDKHLNSSDSSVIDQSNLNNLNIEVDTTSTDDLPKTDSAEGEDPESGPSAKRAKLWPPRRRWRHRKCRLCDCSYYPDPRQENQSTAENNHEISAETKKDSTTHGGEKTEGEAEGDESMVHDKENGSVQVTDALELDKLSSNEARIDTSTSSQSIAFRKTCDTVSGSKKHINETTKSDILFDKTHNALGVISSQAVADCSSPVLSAKTGRPSRKRSFSGGSSETSAGDNVADPAGCGDGDASERRGEGSEVSQPSPRSASVGSGGSGTRGPTQVRGSRPSTTQSATGAVLTAAQRGLLPSSMYQSLRTAQTRVPNSSVNGVVPVSMGSTFLHSTAPTRGSSTLYYNQSGAPVTPQLDTKLYDYTTGLTSTPGGTGINPGTSLTANGFSNQAFSLGTNGVYYPAISAASDLGSVANQSLMMSRLVAGSGYYTGATNSPLLLTDQSYMSVTSLDLNANPYAYNSSFLLTPGYSGMTSPTSGYLDGQTDLSSLTMGTGTAGYLQQMQHAYLNLNNSNSSDLCDSMEALQDENDDLYARQFLDDFYAESNNDDQTVYSNLVISNPTSSTTIKDKQGFNTSIAMMSVTISELPLPKPMSRLRAKRQKYLRLKNTELWKTQLRPQEQKLLIDTESYTLNAATLKLLLGGSNVVLTIGGKKTGVGLHMSRALLRMVRQGALAQRKGAETRRGYVCTSGAGCSLVLVTDKAVVAQIAAALPACTGTPAAAAKSRVPPMQPPPQPPHQPQQTGASQKKQSRWSGQAFGFGGTQATNTGDYNTGLQAKNNYQQNNYQQQQQHQQGGWDMSNGGTWHQGEGAWGAQGGDGAWGTPGGGAWGQSGPGAWTQADTGNGGWQEAPQQPQHTDPVQAAVVANMKGELSTNTFNPNKRKLTCAVCQDTLLGESQYQAHIAGKKHAKKLRLMGMPEYHLTTPGDAKPTNAQHIVQVDQKFFHCTLCKITLNGPATIATHLTGDKHKRNLDPEYAKLAAERDEQKRARLEALKAQNGTEEEGGSDADATPGAVTAQAGVGGAGAQAAGAQSGAGVAWQTKQLCVGGGGSEAAGGAEGGEQMVLVAGEVQGTRTGWLYCRICDMSVFNSTKLQQHCTTEYHRTAHQKS